MVLRERRRRASNLEQPSARQPYTLDRCSFGCIPSTPGWEGIDEWKTERRCIVEVLIINVVEKNVIFTETPSSRTCDVDIDIHLAHLWLTTTPKAANERLSQIAAPAFSLTEKKCHWAHAPALAAQPRQGRHPERQPSVGICSWTTLLHLPVLVARHPFQLFLPPALPYLRPIQAARHESSCAPDSVLRSPPPLVLLSPPTRLPCRNRSPS